MTLVEPLRAFGRTDLALAGGKGANLGELVRAGFPVPDGFVVTTAAYDPAAETVPEELRERIAGAYRELGGGPVAVRSSATAEDLPGAAFAGQQDTYLNIVGEPDLIDAVRRCWASLRTERAVAYRRRLGVGEDEVRIAVVVQRMVEAETAGVMFTADPVSGARDRIVVDAGAGLGEAVVSGLVTPDHYVLDASGRVRERTRGRREVVIRGTAGGGVTRQAGDTGAGLLLPDDALTELARLGTEVARHFGRPQDIEWARAHGRTWLVQARPMTALPPPPIRLGPAQRKLGSILLEYIPYRPYPMDMSTWVPYGPAGLMAKVTEYYGIGSAFDGFLPEVDGVVDRLVPPSPHPTPGMLRTPFRLARMARRHDPARWTEDPRFTAFLAAVRELEEVDLAALPWAELVRVPRRALHLVQPIADLRISYLPRTGLAMLRLLVALKLRGRGALLGDLLMGAPTRTQDANRALESLAALVRENPELKDALTAERVAEFPEFHTAFQDFLREYGHRETASPILVTSPTWGESPGTVLDLVRLLVSEPRGGHPAEPSLGPRFDPLVRAARAGLAFREDSHFYFTKPLPLLRRSLLEIGRRLRDAGVLAEPEEVFHLRLEELEGVEEFDRLPGERLRQIVRDRSARRAELAGVRLIDPKLVFPSRAIGDALVSGAPAGGGTATGPVAIIREPADFGKLAAGDVLVCPYTNPSWTPLFQRAAAVVVDSGGIASHAAIVAREYGIPAVMGTADGTSVLAYGQTVTVDGDAGLVTSGDS